MEGRLRARLAELSEIDQFLILKDSAPTADALALANVQLFAGEPDSGRNGMFPCQATVPLILLLAGSCRSASEEIGGKSGRFATDRGRVKTH